MIGTGIRLTDKQKTIITAWKSCPCRIFRQDKQFLRTLSRINISYVARHGGSNVIGLSGTQAVLSTALRGNVFVFRNIPFFPAAECFNLY